MSDNGGTADELRWYLLFARAGEARLVEAFNFYRAAGIEPIVIKGWAAGRNYPPNKVRTYGDIDLAVSSNDFERARELGEIPGQAIDLHNELRHLDTLPWPQLVERSEVVDIDDTPIRVLCAEDHLRVLCVHWLNDGGQSRERLWDIYYAVENRPAEFDWDKCLNAVSGRRRKWIVSTIGLVHKYLGLDISDLPFADEAKELPEWLIRAVEREWASETRLVTLELCLNDPKAMWQQLRKRFPPNPIQATIEMEGDFDRGSRLKYQALDFVSRIRPSIRRVSTVIKKRIRK